MTRRRPRNKDGSLIVALIDSPWQVSVVVAVIAFVAMRWLVPSQASSPALIPLATMISGFAPLVALFFLFIGGISFFREKGSAIPALVERASVPSYPSRESALPVTPPNTDFGLYTTRWEKKSNVTDWSLELLRSMEWKRFEMLCAEYFRVLGKRVDTMTHGADGGIDARVYKSNSDAMEFAIQCKAWSNMVGVKPVRELYGVMAHESAGKGIFMATSSFSNDAKQFAAEHKDKLFLIDGEKFLSMLLNLPEDKRRRLLDFATDGDYTTPTCASCGIKMVRRKKNESEFWGCKNYPKCRATLKVAMMK